MQLEVNVDGKNIFYKSFYPSWDLVLDGFKSLSPGSQVYFLIKLFEYIEENREEFCYSFIGDWASHNHEEFDKALGKFLDVVKEQNF